MSTENPYITTDAGALRITPAGKKYLERAVTDPEGNVYSFYDTFSPTITAAAMARLSRFGGDMRELMLKEFAGEEGREDALLRRVLTQFGDDSVQQLGYVPVVVENASNLLTKQLQWGRLAAYLEQSTRYIYYDAKRNGEYRYFTPRQLGAPLERTYRTAMTRIFDIYAEIVHKMTDYFSEQDPTPKEDRDAAWRIAIRGKACDAARGLLPVATTSTVGIVGSAQAIDNLIMYLLSQDLPEAQEVGAAILREVRKQHAIFFERTDMPGRGEATVAYRRQTRTRLKKLSSGRFTAVPAKNARPSVALLHYTPKKEMDVLADMLYPHVAMDYASLAKAIASWTTDEKAAAFSLYIGERGNRRHKPGRALEVPHYTFEVVCDYGSFRDLQRHRMADAFEWQALSPSLGYDIPDAVTAAGLNTAYKEACAVSDTLYHALQKAGFSAEAQYATLLTHKMRWKITLNARAAFHFIELRTQPAGHAGYRKIAKLMHDEIAKVHPAIASAMIFVNRNDDDPSASRLEQARRAQKKLQALGLEGLIE